MQELRDLNKPVIAAINGICCGGGLEIALSTDMILAAEHATFALPEIRSGTVADAASIKLPKRIPYHIAMDMLFTGRWLDATEAHRWGFVNEILPADKLMDRAWELARLLESGPPLVYAAIKEVVREAEGSKFQDDDEQDHPAPAEDRGYALRQRGQSRRRPGVCGEARSGLEGQVSSGLFGHEGPR